MKTKASPIDHLLADLGDPSLWWQVATLAMCLALAWLIGRALRAALVRRLEATQARRAVASRPLEIVSGSAVRLVGPLLALVFVTIARPIAERFHSAPVLEVAQPLLVAFVVIRALAYLLRHVFAASGAVLEGERWIALAVWLAVALHLSGLAPELLAWLDQVRLPMGKHKLTMLLLLQAGLSVALTLLVSLWIAAMIERRLEQAEHLNLSLRAVLSRFARALLVLIAILVSLGLVGIDLTVLSVFGGAVGVGLGLGMQRIASNYFSGFIILLDRSIRIGDIITVDKYSGAVTQINTRYTVLKSLDGTEAIVPNEMLVNSPVANLSFTTRENRLAIQVSIAYDSEVARVRDLLLGVAAAHPRVLADPAPMVFLREFGSDGLVMELGFWINDPEGGSLNVRSELNFAIWEAFLREGVKIPYPRREVTLLNAAPPSVNH
ncbi:MAG: mechanosensitive ion channel family protein [Burkholderiales bacterium]